MFEPEPVSMEHVSQNLSGNFTSFVSLIDDNTKNESIASHSNVYFGFGKVKLSPCHMQIVQAIGSLFDSWESWQKKMFFTGLVDRFSKSQLKSLSVAVESVFHRDFITELRSTYPMKKLDQTCEQQEEYKQGSKYVAYQKKEINKFRKGKSMTQQNNLDDSHEFVYKSILPPIEVIDVPRPAKSITLSNSSSSDEEMVTSPKNSLQIKPLQKTFEEQQPTTSSKSMTKERKAEIKKVSSVASLPSLYTFANCNSTNDDAESEFMSRVSQIDVGVEDFFPPKEATKYLGRVVTTQSKAALGKFMTRFDAKRNKLPCPTSKQLYKNTKLWSDQHRIVKAKTLRLKELFRKQMFKIWDWLSDWEEYKRIRLLIHLLSFSTTLEVKFIANCIKSKIEENKAQENLAQLLPEECWMEIFDHLDDDDVTVVSQVCRSWHEVVESENIWKNKCNALGLKCGISDFVEKMEEKATSNEAIDWRQAYFELRRRLKLRQNKGTQLKRKNRDVVSDSVDDEGAFTDSSNQSGSEKESREKLKKSTRGSKKNKAQGLKKTRRGHKSALGGRGRSADDLAAFSGSFEFLVATQEPANVREYVPFWKAKKKEESIAGKKKRKPLKKYAAPETMVEGPEGEEESNKTEQEAFMLALKNKKKDRPEPPKPSKPAAEVTKPDDTGKTVPDSSQDSGRASQVESLPAISRRPFASKSSGFLQMWKTITEVVMETPQKSAPESATKKFDINIVLSKLLTDAQVESMAQKSDEYFAVDHHIEDELDIDLDFPVLPVTKVIAMQGHKGPAWCVLSHGEKVISGGLDKNIRLWNLNGDCYGTMDQEVKGGVKSLAIGADNKCKTLYAGSWDYSVSVFDSLSFKRADMLTGHTNTVSGLAVDGHYIISCSFDGTIRVWCIYTHKCLRVLQVQHSSKAIHCMTYDQRTIITGGADKLVRMTSADTGVLMKTFSGHTTYVSAIKRKGNLIVSGDFEGNLLFWSVDGATTPEANVKGHHSQINGIDFHRSRFFTASDDKLVKEWDIKSRMCVRILQGHTMGVTGVKYASDYLATCSRDGSVRMWFWNFN